MSPRPKKPRKTAPAAAPEWDDDALHPIPDDEPGDVALMRLAATGQAMFWPAGARRLEGEAMALVATLQRAVVERARLLERIEVLVDELRAAGISWAVIGWSLGTTGQAASQRFGAPSSPRSSTSPSRSGAARAGPARKRSGAGPASDAP